MFKLIFLLLFALAFFIVGAVVYVVVVGLLYILSNFLVVIVGAIIIIAIIISANMGWGREGAALISIGLFVFLIVSVVLYFIYKDNSNRRK